MRESAIVIPCEHSQHIARHMWQSCCRPCKPLLLMLYAARVCCQVAAIRALTRVIKNSSAQTMMGLEKDLKDAAYALQRCVTSCNVTQCSSMSGVEQSLGRDATLCDTGLTAKCCVDAAIGVHTCSSLRSCLWAGLLCRCNPTAISLKAGCELFLRYTTRTSALEMEDFAAAKARLIEVSYRA